MGRFVLLDLKTKNIILDRKVHPDILAAYIKKESDNILDLVEQGDILAIRSLMPEGKDIEGHFDVIDIEEQLNALKTFNSAVEICAIYKKDYAKNYIRAAEFVDGDWSVL